MTESPLHIRTPLLYSPVLTQECKGEYDVFVKLDNLQPSGSFKIRGIGRSIQAKAAALAAEGKSGPLTVICSSGGNAGLAAAYAARQIPNASCVVCCPTSTEPHVVKLLEAEGARVDQAGAAWDHCDERARGLQSDLEAKGQAAFYVHPFIGDDVVEGHSSLIDEIYNQLGEEGRGPPDVITVVAGGGGLLAGLLHGVEKSAATSSQPHYPLIVAVQCFGADSYTQSVTRAIEEKTPSDSDQLQCITLPAITSKCTSMGALKCSPAAVRAALKYREDGHIIRNLVVHDDLASSATWKFARDHRMLVEIACGAALSPVYFADRILPQIGAPSSGSNAQTRKILVVFVCGGSKINTEIVEAMRTSEVPGVATGAKAEVDGKPL